MERSPSPSLIRTINYSTYKSLSTSGATMVFQMTSQIVGRKPVERIVRNVHLYELESVQVVVTNPFSEVANFDVRLVVSSKESSAENVLIPERKGRCREEGKREKWDSVM